MKQKSVDSIRLSLVLILCIFANRLLAQQAYPMLMSIEPVAAQIGQVSEHTIKSRYSMADAYQVLISGEGVTGEVVTLDANDAQAKSPLQSLRVRFKVSEHARPGVRDVRLATPNGASTLAQLVVVRDPIIMETADNDRPTSATAFSLPATLCGRIEKAEDVDFYKFHVSSGDQLSFHVRCMNLQDRIHDLQLHADPILTIRNSAGSTVASADNVFAGDPFLAHTFEQAGEYLLELRDVRYKGNEYWAYCIEVNQRPFVQTIFPLAFSLDTTSASVKPIGWLLPAATPAVVYLQPQVQEGWNKLASNRKELDLVEARTNPVSSVGLQPATLSFDDPSSDACLLEPLVAVVAAGQIDMESVINSDHMEGAQSIHLPCGVNGCIEQPNDVDYYAFEAKRGERFTFEVFARRAGSSLDSHLRILDSSGKQLQLNDDLRDGKRNFSDSRIENWLVPEDGRYLVELRDLHLRGGEAFVYFLQATSAKPHFKLYADTDKTFLTPGTSGVIFVRAERKNGFSGEIQLEIDGLPDGVTPHCGRILANSHQDGCIVLTAQPQAQLAVANVEIRGWGMREDLESGRRDENSAVATVYQETYQPGGGRGHWPVQQHAVAVGSPADILGVKVTPQEIQLRPGQSKTLDIEIQRADGFDKNVLLEALYTHLNGVYADPLPAGVTVDLAASTTLLTDGATHGKLTLNASPDAFLVERQQIVVMANVSLNFVMKATYASSPLYITVAP